MRKGATIQAKPGAVITLASTGTELSVPTVIPALTPGAAVPNSAACTTWAAWAAAPFNSFAQGTTDPIKIYAI